MLTTERDSSQGVDFIPRLRGNEGERRKQSLSVLGQSEKFYSVADPFTSPLLLADASHLSWPSIFRRDISTLTHYRNHFRSHGRARRRPQIEQVEEDKLALSLLAISFLLQQPLRHLNTSLRSKRHRV